MAIDVKIDVDVVCEMDAEGANRFLKRNGIKFTRCHEHPQHVYICGDQKINLLQSAPVDDQYRAGTTVWPEWLKALCIIHAGELPRLFDGLLDEKQVMMIRYHLCMTDHSTPHDLKPIHSDPTTQMFLASQLIRSYWDIELVIAPTGKNPYYFLMKENTEAWSSLCGKSGQAFTGNLAPRAFRLQKNDIHEFVPWMVCDLSGGYDQNKVYSFLIEIIKFFEPSYETVKLSFEPLLYGFRHGFNAIQGVATSIAVPAASMAYVDLGNYYFVNFAPTSSIEVLDVGNFTKVLSGNEDQLPGKLRIFGVVGHPDACKFVAEKGEDILNSRSLERIGHQFKNHRVLIRKTHPYAKDVAIIAVDASEEYPRSFWVLGREDSNNSYLLISYGAHSKPLIFKRF